MMHTFIWGNIFIYCIEHNLDFLKIYKQLFDELYEADSFISPDINTLKQRNLFSTVEKEFNIFTNRFHIPASIILNTNTEKGALELLKSANFESHVYQRNALSWELCNAEYEYSDVEMEISEVHFGKEFNYDLLQFEYYVYVNLSVEARFEKVENNKKISCRRLVLSSCLLGPQVELYRCTSGKFADEINFHLKNRGIDSYQILDFKNVVVKTVFKRCQNHGHDLSILKGIVFILDRKTKEVITKTVPIMFCEKCNIYYLHKIDYDSLMLSGRILCRIVDGEHVDSISSISFEKLSKESLYKICGYNVNANEDITDTERQSILQFMIQRNIVTMQEAINFLSWLVQIHKNKDYLAVSKWKKDINFLKGFFQQDIEIGISEITI